MLLSLLVAAGVTEAPKQPTLRQVECVGIPADLPRRQSLTCHRLAVPRDHRRPGAGSYDLAVFVLKPDKPDPAKAPVLFIHGGPGSTIGTPALGRSITESELVPGATVITFHQRGAMSWSEPQPCPEGSRGRTAELAKDQPWRITIAAARKAYLDCRQRAVSQGIDLRHFGTSVTVEDIEVLRRAVRAERFNIFTGSYGSAVVLDLLAVRPQTVRAVAMFGVTRPEHLPEPDSSFDLVVERRAALCRADPACASAHPDFPASVGKGVAALDAAPLTLTIPGRGLRDDRFVLNGRDFEYFLEDVSGSAEGAARMPALAAAAARRDPKVLGPIVVASTARTDNEQMFGRAAVHCRDKARYHRDRDESRGYMLDQLPGVCAKWASLGPVRRLPRNTKVPVLMLVGELDSVTPSDNALAVQKYLGPAARTMTFASESHVVGLTGCTRDITREFFGDPTAELAERCGGRWARQTPLADQQAANPRP